MGERSVDIGSIRLTIAEEGAGGRPLMLVHGFTGAKEDFGDFLVPLADRGWHVVAPDLRGHGASDKPTEESAYTLPIFSGMCSRSPTPSGGRGSRCSVTRWAA